MADGRNIPDGPRLELDPESSRVERVAAMEAHLAEVTRVNRDLRRRLDGARRMADELAKRVDRLERDNNALKSSPSYVATVEEVLDG